MVNFEQQYLENSKTYSRKSKFGDAFQVFPNVLVNSEKLDLNLLLNYVLLCDDLMNEALAAKRVDLSLIPCRVKPKSLRLGFAAKDGSTVRYGTLVRYASIFAKKYGTLAGA